MDNLRVQQQNRKTIGAVLICLGLAVVTCAVFSPALGHQFLTYDDQQYVTENPHVRAGLTWAGIGWAFKSFYASNWHPLTWLSHMADWQMYGSDAGGHHLTNILLHVANTVLLFLVLRRMTGAEWRSACVAALFALHPLHVQSVAWIAERKDVLSGFFWMLTLLAYVRSVKCEVRSAESGVRSAESGRWLFYGLSLVFFALGVMSKPMVVTLPFVLLLLDYWPLRRLEIKNQKSKIKNILWEKVPFLLIAAAGCVVTVLAQRQSHSLVSTAGLPLGRRLGHALIAYGHYVGAMFIPWHLAAFYPYPEHEGFAKIGGAAVLLVMITVLVLRVGRRKPYLAVGWFWFLGTLVPVIGFVQVGDQAWADRYTYLPLIGLFIMVVWGIADVLGSARLKGIRRWLAPGLTIVLAAALAADSLSELRWWHDTRTLFEHALKVTEGNARAMVMVGSFRAEDGKIDEAMELYREALSYRPDDPEAHFFLGRALEQRGNLEGAAGEYSQALWFRPLQERTHIALGLIRAKQGQTEQATAHYRAALAANPESAPAENNLARLLHSEGKLDEAIVHYSNAVRFDPNLAQARNNLGVLLLQKGKLEEGMAQLREALRLNPGDAETQYNLASGLNQKKEWSEAAELLAKVTPSRPQDANAQYQFALSLAHLGKTRDAMSQYAKALLLRQDFPEALDGLAWILATDPHAEFRNGPQALQMSTLACDLTARKQPGMLATLAAAQAENSQFTEAAATVSKAEQKAGESGLAEQAAKCKAMGEAFSSGKAWREGSVTAAK